jgi:hypothetical protein
VTGLRIVRADAAAARTTGAPVEPLGAAPDLAVRCLGPHLR